MKGFPDVQIIGGGIIGASVAYRLATEGARVSLIEAATSLGTGSTSAAIGGITPQSETYCRGPLRHVATWSTELYPDFLRDIEAASGVCVPLLDTGQLEVALDYQSLEYLTSHLLPLWDEEGFQTEFLDREATLAAEPLLTPNVCGSLLLPIEGALEPRLLMEALERSFVNEADVSMQLGRRVRAVSASETSATVLFVDGSRVASDVVVVCGGLGSTALLPLLAAKMYPMKGQALEFRTPATGYALNHHVYCANGGPRRSAYMVPRQDGRLAAGVTYEPGFDDLAVDPERMYEVKGGLAELCPATSAWPIIREWAGVRPASRDGRPFIGYVNEGPHLICCAGHQGLGLTLAPVTAHLVAQLILVDPSHRDPRTSDALQICDPYRGLLDEPLASPAPVGGR